MVDGGSLSTERETWKPPTLMDTVCHCPSLRAWPGRGRHRAVLRLKRCALIRANDWQIWGLCAGAQRVNLHMSAQQRIHYSPWEGRAEIQFAVCDGSLPGSHIQNSVDIQVCLPKSVLQLKILFEFSVNAFRANVCSRDWILFMLFSHMRKKKKRVTLYINPLEGLPFHICCS